MKLSELTIGDLVSSPNIPVGEYQGVTDLEIDGNKISLMKIFEAKKGVVHQLPLQKIDELKALPKKDYFKKSLRVLEGGHDEQLPQKFKTTRYDYIKELSQKNGLKAYLQALKILLQLNEQRTITIAERKLFNKIKEKFYTDVETILGEGKVEAESYLRMAL